MVAAPDQQRPPRRLHNFELPSLNWGSQKLLRPIKVHPSVYSSNFADAVGAVSSPSSLRNNGKQSASPSLPPPPIENFRRIPSLANGGDNRIEEVREEVPIHMQAVIDVEEGEIQEELTEQIPSSARAASDEISRHQENLRLGDSPPPPAGTRQSLRLRGLTAPQAQEKPMAFPKFSIALTPEEIEADFLAMTGLKPPRRPKRRAKHIQKMCDGLSPGLGLSTLTADSYNVSDLPGSKKKARFW